jgi:hypothetical protein
VTEALLVAHVPQMTSDLARRAYDVLVALTGGFYRYVALHEEGIRTVLALRSKYGQPRKDLNDPRRYIDASFRERALGRPAANVTQR